MTHIFFLMNHHLWTIILWLPLHFQLNQLAQVIWLLLTSQPQSPWANHPIVVKFKSVPLWAVNCQFGVRFMQPSSTPFTVSFHQISFPEVLHYAHPQLQSSPLHLSSDLCSAFTLYTSLTISSWHHYCLDSNGGNFCYLHNLTSPLHKSKSQWSRLPKTLFRLFLHLLCTLWQ